MAGQLIARVAEQPLGLGVHERDPAIPGKTHHSVRRCLEQRTNK